MVDKPEGVTSARVVATVKRALGGPKIGHLGTLDPFASGLLPLCVGEGTKAAAYLNQADKSYRGVIRLGVTTDTLDRTGTVLTTNAPPDLASIDLEELAQRFAGTMDQVPPAYSAIKRDGVRMYERARRGETPAIEARPVTIYSLSLTALLPDRLRIELACSKGTYVRSLARDIGQALGCGAILEELVRTSFGDFTLSAALSLEDLTAPAGRAVARRALVGPAEALARLPAVAADEATAQSLRRGRQQSLAHLALPAGAGRHFRVLAPDRSLVAVVVDAGAGWRLDRVFGA